MKPYTAHGGGRKTNHYRSKKLNRSQRKPQPSIAPGSTGEGDLIATLTDKIVCSCGAPLGDNPGRGRKRLFCCNAHKQAEYRNRRNEKRNNSPIHVLPGKETNVMYQGDALTVLKSIEDNCIDCLVTDPPYGYSFMGKDWDKAVPSVDIWKECLRVLKPGAFAFIMSAPRQDVLSQMIIRLSEAGFRTDFTSLYWAYASGYPKAANIAKMVDKKLGTYKEGAVLPSSRIVRQENNFATFSRKTAANPQSDHAKELDGSYGGFQPKPAVEVILVAMKPLSEKTFVDQTLKNGKGVTWLDDCRIPYEYEDIPTERKEHASTIAQMSVVRTDYKP